MIRYVGAAFRHWIGTRSLYGQTGSISAKARNQPNGAAYGRFHRVLARGGLPSNSHTAISTSDTHIFSLPNPIALLDKTK